MTTIDQLIELAKTNPDITSVLREKILWMLTGGTPSVSATKTPLPEATTPLEPVAPDPNVQAAYATLASAGLFNYVQAPLDPRSDAAVKLAKLLGVSEQRQAYISRLEAQAGQHAPRTPHQTPYWPTPTQTPNPTPTPTPPPVTTPQPYKLH